MTTVRIRQQLSELGELLLLILHHHDPDSRWISGCSGYQDEFENCGMFSPAETPAAENMYPLISTARKLTDRGNFNHSFW